MTQLSLHIKPIPQLTASWVWKTSKTRSMWMHTSKILFFLLPAAFEWPSCWNIIWRIVRRAYGSLLEDDDGSIRYRTIYSFSTTFVNLVGFSTYSSDFDHWSGHVGSLPTGQPPSSFGVKWGKGEGHQFLPALVTKLMEHSFIQPPSPPFRQIPKL